MRTQAEKYGADFCEGRVTRLDQTADGFEAEWGEGSARARTVLVATGVRNRRPDMDEELHDEALAGGLIRYCPICDGYEVTDKKIGVIGSGTRGVAEAVFLRGYTADITLIAPDKAHRLSRADRERLRVHRIPIVDGPSRGVAVQKDCIVVETAEGHHAFDSIYPALGTDTHVELAEQVGAAIGGESRCILIDTHQRTNVDRLYAAGDVVLGLDQISHAMGQGGVAATSIRNDLAEIGPLMR
jgi:thioredoxin reductase (NADPH)